MKKLLLVSFICLSFIGCSMWKKVVQPCSTGTKFEKTACKAKLKIQKGKDWISKKLDRGQDLVD